MMNINLIIRGIGYMLLGTIFAIGGYCVEELKIILMFSGMFLYWGIIDIVKGVFEDE
jgi:hypothetical protein